MEQKHHSHHFHRPPKWLTLSLIALLVVSGGAVALFASKPRTQQNNPFQKIIANNRPSLSELRDDPFMQQYGQGCRNRTTTFSSPPMRMQDLAYIRPLGAMLDGHVTPTDHVYVGGPNPSAADNTYPVVMPADGTIVEVGAMPAQYIGDRNGQQVAPQDHRIVISHSCQYFSIYIHVHKLADTLAKATGTIEPGKNKSVNLELKAGDVVGYIGGSTFDWTSVDTTTQLKGFITPALYEREPWKVHTVSPFDLYKEPLKSQLEAKSIRTAAPVGGKIDYDQPGKLVGNWFREGSGGYGGNDPSRYWDGHLAIVPDYIDPESIIVSIGNWSGSAQQLLVSGAVNPAGVDTQAGMVKYELKKLNYGLDGKPTSSRTPTKGLKPLQTEAVVGTIAFQVLPGEKLKVEAFPAKTAAQVTGFTQAAQTYTR